MLALRGRIYARRCFCFLLSWDSGAGRKCSARQQEGSNNPPTHQTSCGQRRGAQPGNRNVCKSPTVVFVFEHLTVSKQPVCWRLINLRSAVFYELEPFIRNKMCPVFLWQPKLKLELWFPPSDQKTCTLAAHQHEYYNEYILSISTWMSLFASHFL